MQDDRLVEYQRKVMTLSKDFRALFMERVSREDNMRADRLANDAIDEELQVVDSLSEFIDQEWTSHEKHASQQHSVHTHAHQHNSRPHTHPLPLPAPHLKVKPVASVSPHVVKRHFVPESNKCIHTTKSDDISPARRSRLFCSDEEKVEQTSSPLRNHVQAAAKSRRKPAGCRHPARSEISASMLLPHLDVSPFSDETSGGDTNLQQGVEGNSVSGSGTGTDEQGGLMTPFERFDSVSGSSEESVSDADFSEEDYERLVKTLLEGFLQKKKGIRS